MKDSAEFILRDYSQTLFPLKLNRFMVENYSPQLLAFARQRAKTGGDPFQTQHPVYASKRGWFLRRTVKLDPVAEMFLYDLVYSYRERFSRRPIPNREVYGFRIAGGEPLSGVKAYGEFKTRIAGLRRAFYYQAYMDIASFFNHIYHHDLVEWFEELGASLDDVNSFGKFLREAAGGRTVDCLPQGIYPAKMIGSAFLSFVERSNRVRSRHTVRLMDDIWLFDTDHNAIVSDFLLLQDLLGKRGLSINDKKSALFQGYDPDGELPADLDQMKMHLLQRRRAALSKSNPYADEVEEKGFDGDGQDAGMADQLGALKGDEHEYLRALLKGDTIQEEDAELVLTLMRDQSADVLESLPSLMRDFPSLAKRIYSFCAGAPDKNEITAAAIDFLATASRVTEYQLFWLGAMVDDYLIATPRAGELLLALYENEAATAISRAKILEIADMRYGLRDLRQGHLRSGSSDWMAWAAAVGSRNDPKGQRNQSLKYFRTASAMNQLIGEFVESCY